MGLFKTFLHSLQEASEFKPSVGCLVRIPTSQAGITQLGTVIEVSENSVKVEAKDGHQYMLESKNIFDTELLCKNYKDFSWDDINPRMFEPDM